MSLPKGSFGFSASLFAYGIADFMENNYFLKNTDVCIRGFKMFQASF